MSLTMFLGPMFSGKTTALVEAGNMRLSDGKTVLGFRPDLDVRPTRTIHDDSCFDTITVTYLPPRVDADIILIDESQFFHPDLLRAFILSHVRGHEIFVAGLLGTFRRTPFHSIAEILPLANTVLVFSAMCDVCDGSATLTKRTVASDKAILVGDKESYEPRCFDCWDK